MESQRIDDLQKFYSVIALLEGMRATKEETETVTGKEMRNVDIRKASARGTSVP